MVRGAGEAHNRGLVNTDRVAFVRVTPDGRRETPAEAASQAKVTVEAQFRV